MFILGDRKLQNVLVSCDHGMMIVNRFDRGPDNVSVGAHILDHGNNNTVEANTVMQVLANVENPIIFDIGANIGTFASWVSMWAAERNGKIYCFEPQRSVFQMLCGNMAINNIFNVHAYEMALGRENKFIELPEVKYDEHASFASFTLDSIDTTNMYKTDSSKTQRIKMMTLDSFMKEYQVPKVDFIKVDAEGLDIDVLEGGMDTIMRYKPDLYVEYLNLGPSKKEDTTDQGREFLTQYLQNLGYKTLVIHHDIYASVRDVFVQQ